MASYFDQKCFFLLLLLLESNPVLKQGKLLISAYKIDCRKKKFSAAFALVSSKLLTAALNCPFYSLSMCSCKSTRQKCLTQCILDCLIH